jgi:hypothetical protein
MDAIYWVNCRYKLIIYRYLHNNIISVIEDNTFNNLQSITYNMYWYIDFILKLYSIILTE